VGVPELAIHQTPQNAEGSQVFQIFSRPDRETSLALGLDYGSYDKGIKVSDAEMEQLKLKRNKFHGEWNYSLIPRHS
jgi:hypothetical protein